MNKILIGSVFTNFKETNKIWLDLQTQAFDSGAITGNGYEYTLLTYIQQDVGDYKKMFEDRTDIIHIADCEAVTNVRHKEMVRQHYNGLNLFEKVFIEKIDEFDHFIFIDSDAFPVNKKWYEILGRRRAASIFRSENLQNAIYHQAFAMFDQTSMLKMKKLKRRDVFPMLRSNQYNIHPFLCGVYYDTIYHHGCGSRGRVFRTKKYWQCMTSNNNNNNNKKIVDNLYARPGPFLRRFMWCKKDCIWS